MQNVSHVPRGTSSRARQAAQGGGVRRPGAGKADAAEVLHIKKRYGKNAILKGMNLE